jgi:hypothetical protein
VSASRHVAVALAAACLAGAAVVLAPVPAGVRALVVLPIALLAPGLCLTRLVGLREPLIEVALAFPLSAALWIVMAQAQLYLHLWAPRTGIVVLLLASAASVALEPRRPTARARAERTDTAKRGQRDR